MQNNGSGLLRYTPFIMSSSSNELRNSLVTFDGFFETANPYALKGNYLSKEYLTHRIDYFLAKYIGSEFQL